MKYSHFFSRLAALVLIVGLLALYQVQALTWDRLVSDNQAAIQEIEADNAAILAAQAEAEAEEIPAARWLDGTYTGSAEGFGGTITVSVTILDDTITDLTIVDAAGEDTAYLKTAMAVVDSILTAQSTDVDTVSGATFSSTGIRNAADAALLQAENKEGNS